MVLRFTIASFFSYSSFVIPPKGSLCKSRGRNPSLLFAVNINKFPQKKRILKIFVVYKQG
jgi:hypothetical protein